MSTPPPSSCPRCNAPRVVGPDCPRCGVIYARAEARLAHLALLADVQEEARLQESERFTALTEEPGEREEAAWPRLVVVPAALLVAWVAVSGDLTHFLLRTFLSMWVHETGHAVTAWLCGYHAVPGPWFTPVAGERSVVFALLVAAALGWLTRQGWRTRRLAVAFAGAGLLLVQAVCTLGLSEARAQQLIYFGGDGGSMVLGSLLLATVLLPAAHPLQQRRLTWGFAAIGAAGLVDPLETWWAARTDAERIPFGAIEGVGLSDPSQLTEVYGWAERTLVSRYVGLGIACLLVLAALHVLELRRLRRRQG